MQEDSSPQIPTAASPVHSWYHNSIPSTQESYGHSFFESDTLFQKHQIQWFQSFRTDPLLCCFDESVKEIEIEREWERRRAIWSSRVLLSKPKLVTCRWQWLTDVRAMLIVRVLWQSWQMNERKCDTGTRRERARQVKKKEAWRAKAKATSKQEQNIWNLFQRSSQISVTCFI